MQRLRQTVILAGGQGTRLRPLTLTTPKPLIKIHGKPFAEYLIELLKKNGIEEIIFLTGYLAEQFPEVLGDGSRWGLSIKYSQSPMEAESGTRIKNASHMLDDTFFLMYGDNYWPVPVSEFFDFHRKKKKLITMGAYNNRDGKGEYGFENNLTVGEDGLLKHYGVRGEGESATDIGTFAVEKHALDFMPEGNPVFQRDLIRSLVPLGQVAVFRTDIPYCYITDTQGIGAAETYLRYYGQ